MLQTPISLGEIRHHFDDNGINLFNNKGVIQDDVYQLRSGIPYYTIHKCTLDVMSLAICMGREDVVKNLNPRLRPVHV
jgi:hypothetical protein